MAEAQKEFLFRWVPPKPGKFLELDAGDGIIGSHAVWLEETGWTGACLEERAEAGKLLQKNRPASWQNSAAPSLVSSTKYDLVSARREGSILRLKEEVFRGIRPRWLILQARDPQPKIFLVLSRAGYRLDNFIHDDEYYRLQRN